MQIAQTLSGYSLGEADMLRRAMGKKIKKEMDAQRARFVDGAVERGLTWRQGGRDLRSPRQVRRLRISTRILRRGLCVDRLLQGWFKANHPAEFLAASMTLDKGNTDKLAEFRAEAQRLGIKVMAPSVNEFLVDFDVRTEAQAPTIHYALSAIKGVGEAQAEALVDARRSRAFASLGDMAARLDPRAVNKKALESLAAAGLPIASNAIERRPSRRSSRRWRSPIVR